MTTDVASLPDDPETLRALLLAERARSERLAQIIKELQRHRFGRRAESLPEDQLLLALEEVEQALSEAEAIADAEVGSSGVAKRTPSAVRTVARFPNTCRGWRQSSTSRTRPAAAAAVRSI